MVDDRADGAVSLRVEAVRSEHELGPERLGFASLCFSVQMLIPRSYLPASSNYTLTVH